MDSPAETEEGMNFQELQELYDSGIVRDHDIITVFDGSHQQASLILQGRPNTRKGRYKRFFEREPHFTFTRDMVYCPGCEKTVNRGRFKVTPEYQKHCACSEVKL